MQSIQQLRDACGRLKGSTEGFPFDLHTLVFKVGGKMYALLALNSDPLTLALKCDPERAEVLRTEYEAIVPGYHLNKKHWNTLTLEAGLPDALLSELLEHSYSLVMGSLTRAQRAELG